MKLRLINPLNYDIIRQFYNHSGILSLKPTFTLTSCYPYFGISIYSVCMCTAEPGAQQSTRPAIVVRPPAAAAPWSPLCGFSRAPTPGFP